MWIERAVVNECDNCVGSEIASDGAMCEQARGGHDRDRTHGRDCAKVEWPGKLDINTRYPKSK